MIPQPDLSQLSEQEQQHIQEVMAKAAMEGPPMGPGGPMDQTGGMGPMGPGNDMGPMGPGPGMDQSNDMMGPGMGPGMGNGLGPGSGPGPPFLEDSQPPMQ